MDPIRTLVLLASASMNAPSLVDTSSDSPSDSDVATKSPSPTDVAYSYSGASYEIGTPERSQNQLIWAFEATTKAVL